MSKTQQLAQKVIYIRGRSSFTQEEIANKLGVSRQSWILVEKGQRDLNTEELKKLSEIFGVDIVDFFKETPNIDKFKQMYFACIRLAADEQGGIPKTKLAKLLYLVDFSNFFYSLESMSGIKYRRMQYGPVAEVFFSLTEDLYEGGDINIQPVSEALIISATTKEQATDKLKPKELKLIKTICSLWKNKRTMEIVNFTHQQKPWKMCREGEYIPYELIIQEDPEHVYQPFTRQ
ncbi:MAG: DUF4065 domain-containing protein [Candidatus Saccharibacteria bacterium]|nr:DUF4065 domain-containing protein [Candidatus Saccharibacteria bacterium]